MKTLVTTIVSIWLLIGPSQEKNITVDDVAFLNKTEWSGNLMYINYSDGKEVNLPTELIFSIKKNSIIMDISYPNEPKANGKSRIKLDGKAGYFGDEEIISVERRINELKFTTQFTGKDNNKPATMTKEYILTDSKIEIAKSVKYNGSEESFVRNKYSYIKK